MSILLCNQDFWLVIRKIECSEKSNRLNKPIIDLKDAVSSKSQASLYCLKKYYENQEKDPNAGVRDADLRSIKKTLTDSSGKIECFYCKENILANQTNFDHYIPYYLGGKNHFSNLKISCVLCNEMKGSIHPVEMPITWSIFLKKALSNQKVMALSVLQEAKKVSMGEKETVLVDKLILKEISWRHGLSLKAVAS